MLYWLLACKITFAIATFAVEDEQKNRASNTFQQFAISTGRYTVLQDGTFAMQFVPGYPRPVLAILLI